MKYIAILFFLAMIIRPVFSSARNYSYIRFTTDEGLAGNNVYNIRKDKDGFIWVATETGLSRFDGSRFRNYTVNQGLPQNDIVSILPDLKGRMWIGPFGKSYCYYLNGKIYTRKNSRLLEKIPLPEPQFKSHTLVSGTDGSILIKINDTLLVFISSSDQVTYLSFFPQSSSFKVVDGFGELPSSLLLPVEVIPAAVDPSVLFAVDFKMEWSLWSFMDTYYIYKDNKLVTIVPSTVKSKLGCFFLNDSCLLFTTTEGAFIYDFIARKYTDSILSGMAINCAFIDEDNGIWLGANGRGLFYFPPHRSTFVSPGIREDISTQIFYFNSFGDKLWAGSKNGELWEVDIKNQSIGAPISMTERNFDFLRQEAGVIQLQPGWGTFAKYSETIYPFSITATKSIMNYGDTFVTTTYNGTIQRFVMSHIIDFLNIGKRATCALYVDGIFYVGTLDGLVIVPHQQSDNLSNDPVIKGCISTLAYGYQDSILWVGTTDKGLYCLKNNKMLFHINESKGLSNNICKCIFTDGNKAYVGTNDGLNVIDPKKQFKNDKYYKQDGLLSNEINCIYARGDTVVTGTANGISFINVASVIVTPPSKVILTEVVVADSSLDITKDSVMLQPWENNIRFSFSSICYKSMGRIDYFYRLKGLFDSWQSTKNGDLQFPSLPAGNYVLEVYAVNRFNLQGEKMYFSFTIKKKLLQYWWVQALLIFSVIGVVFFIISLRARREREKEKAGIKLKGKILELEQLALRSQMNPHFIFNSLNSFYQYVINQDLVGASEFMGNFSRLIRLLFETTSLTRVSLKRELEFLETYMKLEQIKHNHKFKYQFNLPQNLNTEHIILPTFIIQPFIENSIRHGIQNRNDHLGYIHIDVFEEDYLLKVIVVDNGIGRLFAEKQKGNIRLKDSKGILLTTERIELYNKIHNTQIRFEIEDRFDYNGKSAGTAVVLMFPINDVYDSSNFGG